MPKPLRGFVLQIKAEAFQDAANRERRVAVLLREIADAMEHGFPFETDKARKLHNVGAPSSDCVVAKFETE